MVALSSTKQIVGKARGEDLRDRARQDPKVRDQLWTLPYHRLLRCFNRAWSVISAAKLSGSRRGNSTADCLSMTN